MSINFQQHARPYANAAFQWAAAAKQETQWAEALNTLASIFSDVGLKTSRSDPRLGAPKVAEVVVEALGAALDIHQQNFLKLLAKQRRFDLIPSIALQFEALLAASKNCLNVEVSSAFALTDIDQQRLIAKLQLKYQKNIQLAWQLDPSLMGGIQIKVGDEVIDASIRGKLQQLSTTLSKPA